MRLQSSLKTRCKILLRGFWKSCSAQHDHQMMKMDDDIYFLSKIHSNPSSHSVRCHAMQKNGVCANCHPSICLLSTTHPLRRARFYMSRVPPPSSSSFPNCLNKQNVPICSSFFEQQPQKHSFTMHHLLFVVYNYFVGKIDLNDHNYPFLMGRRSLEVFRNTVLQQVLSLLR